MHTHTYAHTHTHICTNNTYTHNTHAHTHAHTHALTHAHTHAHAHQTLLTFISSLFPSLLIDESSNDTPTRVRPPTPSGTEGGSGAGLFLGFKDLALDFKGLPSSPSCLGKANDCLGDETSRGDETPRGGKFLSREGQWAAPHPRSSRLHMSVSCVSYDQWWLSKSP